MSPSLHRREEDIADTQGDIGHAPVSGRGPDPHVRNLLPSETGHRDRRTRTPDTPVCVSGAQRTGGIGAWAARRPLHESPKMCRKPFRNCSFFENWTPERPESIPSGYTLPL